MDKSLIPLPENFVDYIEIRGRNVLAPTGPNTRVALYKLRQEGFTFTHNVFSDKRFIGGVAMSTDAGGQVTDETVTAIRTIIKKRWGFYPPPQETLLQIYLVCREHSFNPVQDYLNSLTWDGVPRIDNMLRDYFKAPDTDFVRGVSRIVMIASVRRVFEPGCKFDYMTVLESGEGKDKSGGLEILYGIEYFSDQSILGLDDKHLAETIQGRWCIESADLDGMKKAEVAKIKAQLSRNTDRTRPAYGRVVIDRPRSCVFWGTTKEQDYLRSQTGNRRFFPVTV